MEKLVLLLAAMTFSWLGVEAQAVASADSVAVDSLDALAERFVNLGEVTVTGASVINKRDRKWIIPSQECKQAASNGSDLLRKMKLLGVKVGVIDGAISMYNGGTIKLYINGRPANDKDVQAIDPKSVERVEYHDVPSLRYGDADLVLDFIVKVPNSGGRVGGMGQVVPFKGLETQFRKNIEVNYKKSTFRVHFYDELLTGFKHGAIIGRIILLPMAPPTLAPRRVAKCQSKRTIVLALLNICITLPIKICFLLNVSFLVREMRTPTMRVC